MTATTDRTVQLGLVGIVCLGIALRLAFLGEASFWTDEAYSLWFARHSISYLWTVVPTYETHPPFYYTLLHYWRVFGEDEGTIRSLSVIFSTAIIVFGALAARGVVKTRTQFVMLVTAGLLAVAPAQLDYAREARPYAAFCAAVALMIFGGVRLANNPERAGRFLWREPGLWAPVAIGLTLAPWFHYVGLLYAFAFGLFLLFTWAFDQRFNWRFATNVILIAVVALGLFLPQLGSMLSRSAQWGAASWVERPELWSVALYLQQLFAIDVPGVSTAAGRALLVLGGAGVAVGVLRLWLTGARSIAVLLVSVAFVPIALAVAISLISTPILMLRIITPSQTPYWILLAVGLSTIPWRPLRIALAGGVMAGFIAIYVIFVVHHENEPWRKITADISSQAKPGDLVIVAPNEAMIPFEVYYRSPPGVTAPYVLPAPYPALHESGPYPAGVRSVPGVTPARAAYAASLADAHPGRVFVVMRGADLFDPTGYLDKALGKTRKLEAVDQFEGRTDVKIFGPPRAAN